jgi:hypothetical protein
MKFLLPTGIGDSVWALHKIQGVAAKHGATEIDVGLVCGEQSKIETRAIDFIQRFKFINSVRMCSGYSILKSPAFRADGCWNYIEDGFYRFRGEDWCVLIPNEPLERGVRLEQWLPDIPIRWDIWDDFEITNEEVMRAQEMRRPWRPYVVFYPGPLDGNTVQGHNRDMLWKPQDWINLGQRIHNEFDHDIVTVGASYDASYYDTLLAPNLNGTSGYWTNLIGKTNIGELFSVTLNARFVISYQAGVGIVSSYRGTPTGIFWRPKGNSIVRDAMLSFDEGMASAWVNPEMLQHRKHLPLIYGKHDVDYIMHEVRNRLWV